MVGFIYRLKDAKTKKNANQHNDKKRGGGGAIFANLEAMHVPEVLSSAFPFMRLFSSLSKSKHGGDAKRHRLLGKEECGYSSGEASTIDGSILERELGKKMKGRAKEGPLRPGQEELQRKMREMSTLKTYIDELAEEELQHVREARKEKAKRDALFPINPLPLFLFIMNALVNEIRLTAQTMVTVPRASSEIEEWLLSASVALVTLCVMNSALLLCCLFGRGKHEEAEEFVSESRVRRVLRRYLEVKAGKPE